MKKFNEYEPEERREIAARGGRASGERRRQLAETKKFIAEYFLQDAIKEGVVKDVDEFYRWLRAKARKERELGKIDAIMRENQRLKEFLAVYEELKSADDVKSADDEKLFDMDDIKLF